MARFLHKRTGKTITVPDGDVPLYDNPRHVRLDVEVPDGSVAKVLEWVGDDPERREAALAAELAGRKRSTLIAALS